MKDLDSYLNDDLAGSISALELIAHWAEVHKGEPLGSFFVATEREIKEDQDTLRNVMRSVGVEESKLRQAGAWAAEKIGRARLIDRKSTRLNSSHVKISYAVFCLKK